MSEQPERPPSLLGEVTVTATAEVTKAEGIATAEDSDG